MMQTTTIDFTQKSETKMGMERVFVFLLLTSLVNGFVPPKIIPEKKSLSATKSDIANNDDDFDDNKYTRRNLLKSIGKMSFATATTSIGATSISSTFFPSFMQAIAEDAVVTEATSKVNPIPMKTFIDPKGLFSIRVPQSFFTLRRTFKGDLPDAKTGQGRRGSSIFSAGDMTKAEVIAVERFPTFVLLEEDGVTVSPTDDLSNFSKLGTPLAIASLLNRKREREKQGSTQSSTGTKIVNDSVKLLDDGKSLTFELRTKIDVQKPELLMEQMGVSELTRITLAKATIVDGEEGVGQMMVVYASALDTDFYKDDGLALQESIDSFIAK